jgi:hypothetical protein
MHGGGKYLPGDQEKIEKNPAIYSLKIMASIKMISNSR